MQADALLIDEMSMVDVPLMRNVMRGLKRGTALILVGDVDQLPRLGPATCWATLSAAAGSRS